MSADPRPLAALTGATGFLGARLVQALDAAGFAVRALARRPPAPPGWGHVAPQVIAGDLSDPAVLRALASGAATVVHCAGLTKARSLDAFLAVNRDGTERLAEAVRDVAPQADFLLVSSLAARHPEVSPYALSKRAGEITAAEILPRPPTVIRPPALYGPGDPATFALFRAAAKSPVLPALTSGARVALAHVDDAAAQIAALAKAPVPGTWALCDGRPQGYDWREIMTELQHAVGRPPRIVPIPGPLLAFVALVGQATGLDPAGKIGEVLHKDWAIRASELPPGRPAPRWSLAAGFAATANWYKQAGWLG